MNFRFSKERNIYIPTSSVCPHGKNCYWLQKKNTCYSGHSNREIRNAGWNVPRMVTINGHSNRTLESFGFLPINPRQSTSSQPNNNPPNQISTQPVPLNPQNNESTIDTNESENIWNHLVQGPAAFKLLQPPQDLQNCESQSLGSPALAFPHAINNFLGELHGRTKKIKKFKQRWILRTGSISKIKNTKTSKKL